MVEKKYCVYWIRLDTHNDYNKEGYIGISSNMKRREYVHQQESSSCKHVYHALKKYKSSIQVDILANNLDNEAACLLEEMLRPEDKIGWNLVKGGGLPPNHTGAKRKQSTKDKIGNALRGVKRPERCGENSNNFKTAVTYKGTSVVDGSVILLKGKLQIKAAGFTPTPIYKFVRGIYNSSNYRGYTWEIV
jgi:hypothetical protein